MVIILYANSYADLRIKINDLFYKGCACGIMDNYTPKNIDKTLFLKEKLP